MWRTTGPPPPPLPLPAMTLVTPTPAKELTHSLASEHFTRTRTLATTAFARRSQSTQQVPLRRAPCCHLMARNQETHPSETQRHTGKARHGPDQVQSTRSTQTIAKN